VQACHAGLQLLGEVGAAAAQLLLLLQLLLPVGRSWASGGRGCVVCAAGPAFRRRCPGLSSSRRMSTPDRLPCCASLRSMSPHTSCISREPSSSASLSYRRPDDASSTESASMWPCSARYCCTQSRASCSGSSQAIGKVSGPCNSKWRRAVATGNERCSTIASRALTSDDLQAECDDAACQVSDKGAWPLTVQVVKSVSTTSTGAPGRPCHKLLPSQEGGGAVQLPGLSRPGHQSVGAGARSPILLMACPCCHDPSVGSLASRHQGSATHSSTCSCSVGRQPSPSSWWPCSSSSRLLRLPALPLRPPSPVTSCSPACAYSDSHSRLSETGRLGKNEGTGTTF
jgi:hypothetical protein